MTAYHHPPPDAERRRRAGDVADRLRRRERGRRSGRPAHRSAGRSGRNRSARSARSGSTSRLGSSTRISSSGALTGDLGKSFVHGDPALKLILERMPATLELAFAATADGDRARHSARALCRPQAGQLRFASRSWRVDPRLLAADLLGRPDADHGVRRDARLAAVDRARPDRDLFSASRRACSRSTACATLPAGAQSRAVQDLAGDPPDAGRRARGDAAGLHQVRARQGPLAAAASSACTC